MKPTSFLLLAFSCACAFASPEASAGSGHGIHFLPAERKAPVGPPATDAELTQRRNNERFGGFSTEDSGAKGWDLMAHSEFIAMEAQVTLVPKGAILHVPERFKANVVSKPEGSILLWHEFLGRYRGMVACFDVTLKEASGETPLDAARFDAAVKSGLIVVAVHNRNPISIHRGASAP